ncbi:hypothetical protein [Lachnoclostridium sp. An76]|uniref:hypothetical protein n=1 Tax=Lachnoclostridium sp. An76 TaxID=1965654 RepID=UPI000B395B11|nr:hypothetical protein [Lachnoclostridium sp. An76]OUN35237.1 hypothetical protein B5G27_06325 [Lachnoclostridium sp. An76]
MRLKRICKHAWKRLVAMALVIAMLNTSVGPVSVQAEDIGETGVDDPQTVTLYTDDANGNTGNTDGNEEPGEESGDAADTSGSAGDTETKEQENVPAEQNVYDSGLIRIYNLEQLEAVGTGAQVYSGDDSADTFGTGDAVTDENGSAVVYGNDAAYMLMNEISLDSSDLWQLPAGFAGSFTGTGGNAGSPLYDAETDTIYIYNNYQLGTANDPEALKTVMSNDMIAEEFGMGQIVFADEAEETQLEYTDAHNYVLTTDFTSEMPELKAAEVLDTENDGRKFQGQVIFTADDGTEYILIGNEDQLRAIGTGKHVYSAVYQAYLGVGWHMDTHNGEYIMLYGGDADLTQEQNGNKTYDFQAIEKASSQLSDHKGNAHGRCGVNQKTGEPDPNLDIENSGHTYDNDENYIIFRNIDLLATGENSDGEDTPWEPLMFSGNMIGSVNMAGIDVETGVIDKSAIDPVEISNITVNKSGEIDLEKDPQGAGFFGTIGSLPGEDGNILMSKGLVTVTGLDLKNVIIKNESTEVKHDVGLLDGIVGGLAWVLDLILGLFGIDSVGDLSDMLLNGMDANPSMFAAGSFAGAISGQVEISKCSVENATVNNVADRTGGFVGDVQGKTLYTLTGVGELTDLLAKILNGLPFLGLGNIVDVLLNGGILDLDQLIPVGFAAPVIKDCHLTNVKQDIGSANTSFNGGFAGRIEGGFIQNVTMTQNTDLTVTGNKFAGGFAGSIANTEVKGLLDQLDIDLFEAVFSQSIVSDVKVSGTGKITVSGSDKEQTTAAYTGGFSGYIASSYVIRCAIENLGKVSSSGNYVGGFTGYTSPGASITLNEEYTGVTKVSILDDVLELLKDVLAGVESGKDDLLSLVGVSPAHIYGCEASGLTGAEITGKDYVGGFAGRADGAKFGTSSQDTLSKLDPVKDNKVSYNGEDIPCSATNISVVRGKEGYAGGFIGYAATASMAGILDSTLVGAANVVPVEADGVVIRGNSAGMTVQNEKGVAAGAVGAAIGTNLKNVKVENVKEITSPNDAAGFVSKAGVGNLVSAGGLNILGLIKINSLLSVAGVIQVNISDSSVSGMDGGFTVSSTGETDGNMIHRAGGFVADGGSAIISGSTVNGLKKVSTKDEENGYAGGFVGISQTDGLADLADDNNEETVLPETTLISITDLLTAVPYLIPKYTDCDVVYAEDTENYQVEAACAGGFAGKLESGTIDNSQKDNIAVQKICNVRGKYYAGGFAGIATSGGLAASRGGIDLLGANVNVGDLVSVLNVYIPVIKNAGVSSDKGLTVVSDGKIETAGEETAADTESSLKQFESNSGSAGGYLGFGSGVQISGCDVNKLRHTNVQEPEDLQQQDGSAYFAEDSKYAVKAPQYAGGFVGKLDIGNAAAVGNGLGVLDKVLNLQEALDVLDVVSSNITDSDVTGDAGGFSVLADGKESGKAIGHAGGYAGSVDGSLIENSNSHNFAYIIGQETAGGFVGNMEPGSVAEVIGDVNVLGGIASVENLASILNSFIPRIHSSSTDAVPCGGVVRAEAESEENDAGGIDLKGVAGGYVGYNNGGEIEGQNGIIASADRIRSVYGYEYAGGYTGYLQNANLVDTGSISLLFGLIKLDNPLQGLQAVYATQTDTSVTGPLRNLSYDRFRSWYESVGKNGAYGSQFKDLYDGGATLYDQNIEKYIYGYEVTAGRADLESNADKRAGVAGGYVGKMTGSIVTNGQAYDLKRVEAMRSAGGYAGEMTIGSLAGVGGLEVAGVPITQGLDVLQTFVPVINNSSVRGYASGIEIEATGYSDQENDHQGNAGGYAGYVQGGTIMGTADAKCAVNGIKSVKAREYAGGYAGQIVPGSLATVDTSSQNGLLEQLLGAIIGTPGDLASLLNATISRVEYSEVTAYSDAGYVVDGTYKSEGTVEGILSKVDGSEKYAKAVGGYAGMLQGAVIGDSDIDTPGIEGNHDSAAGAIVKGVRRVTGGEYAGGFVGLGDVSAVAEVSAGGTSILGKLLGLGALDVLDAFRTYIYDSSVTGSTAYGLIVNAKEGIQKENQEEGDYTVYSGSAGGFAGTLLNGTILNSSVDELKAVEAVNYSGGFIGHSGKSGLVDLDDVGLVEGALGNLLGANAGIADVCGSTIKDSTVTGMKGGYTVKSSNGDDEIAGGFIGNGDLARMENNHASELKQVASDKTAGGFIGKTSFAYLIQVGVNSGLLQPLVDLLLALVNGLLQPDKLPDDGIIHISLGEEVLDIKVLNENGVLSATILGLKVSVELIDEKRNVIQVNIGDSSITIQASGDSVTAEEIKDVINISLIKANRTRVVDSTVTGTSIGYDVFGAGATNDEKGSGDGYAGGFVGYNNEGLLENNIMDLADTIKGADGKIGEFSGTSSLKSNYTELKDIEGTNNTYHVYRKWDDGKLTHIYNNSNVLSSNGAKKEIGGISYYDYSVQHMQYENMYKHNDVWNGAYQTTAKNIARFPVNVYVSGDQADLMLGTPTYANESDIEDIESEMQDPCAAEGDHTFQKVWVDDGNSGNTRPSEPSEINVTLKAAKEDGTEDQEASESFKMDASMAGSDKDVWTTSVDAPINYADADGTIHKYDYTVTEVPIKNSSGDQTYATIYKDVDDYTHQIINYLPTELIREDTVVIDYGLSVDIDVLTNDKALENGGKLVAVAAERQPGAINEDTKPEEGQPQEDPGVILDETLLGKVTDKLASGFETKGEAAGTYGTAYIKAGENGAADEIRFTPDTMEMDSCQQIMYAVQLPDNNGQSQYVYGMVTVVPATIIYYEDNSGAIHYKDGGYSTEKLEEDELANLTDDKDNWKTHGKWSIVTDGKVPGSDVQDTDRPGEAEIKEVIDNVYGNDTHYRDCNTYSNGSSHYVRVSAVNTYQNGGTSPMATFTFKGTGFDLISLTSRDTGAVTIRVYKGTNNEGERILNHTVDTYYGYTCTRDKETGRLIWTPDESSTDILYQIPILKEEMEEYGQYYVEVVPMYYDMYDKYDDKYYDIYVDAVRIYDPADPKGNDYKVIEDVYQTDGENHPDYTELRQILLNADNVGGQIPNGAVFVDGNGELGNISAYESFGPKNEVYLAPGQAISFYLWTNEKPDKVQLGAKLALGTDTKLAIATAVQEGDPEAAKSWSFYKVKNWDINTSYDMYYEFTDNCVWEEADGENPYMAYRTAYPIVIANPKTLYGDGKLAENEDTAILSLTNLQWTGRTSGATEDVEDQPGTEEGTMPGQDDVQARMAKAGARTMQVMAAEDTQDSITLMASVAPENIPAAYYFINQSDSSEEDGGQTTPGEGEEGGGQTTPGEGEEGGSQTTPGEGEEGGGQTTPGEGEEGGSQTTPETGDNNAQQKPAGQAPGNNEDSAGDPADKTPDKSGYSAVQTGDMVAAAGFAVLFAMMALSAIAASAAVYYRRKRR